MSKEEFLQELERKLHVLNEQERRDVLEDYAQHIDLKVKNGQMEEEAVHSLGDPGELAAELLDVYHINSEYASDSAAAEKVKGDLHDGQDKTAQERGQKKRLIRKLPGRTSVSSASDREEKQAVRMRKNEERRIKKEAKKERKQMNRKQREYRQERTIISRALECCADLIRACILFFCKVCLFAAVLPVMILGAFCLFLGGVVLVLLLQGYPLVGAGIGTLGLTMSSFGLTALILSWVFTGKKDRRVKKRGVEASVSVSQRAEENASQPDHAREFTEKTTEEPQD